MRKLSSQEKRNVQIRSESDGPFGCHQAQRGWTSHSDAQRLPPDAVQCDCHCQHRRLLNGRDSIVWVGIVVADVMTQTIINARKA